MPEQPQSHAARLAAELGLAQNNVQGAIDLIDAGNTVPFIARYRKEATGSMDDQVLRALADRLAYLRGLDARKAEVTAAIEGQGALTPALAQSIAAAATLAEVEDLYRPYRPKRRTRASVAKARGLQPLADAILRQDAALDPAREAAAYLSGEVPDTAAALAGAQDILAEHISDDAACRAELRRWYRAFGRVCSAAAKPDTDSVYAPYYDYAEPLARIPGHRVLALDRGEREGFLKVSIAVDAARGAALTAQLFARRRTGGASALLVEAAAKDAYARLIHPSLENELRAELTQAAAEGAIKVFGDNLRQLLLQPPIRGRVVMGLDPGYRMGCKVAVVDATGKVLDTAVLYPVPEFKRVEQAKATAKALIQKHGVQVLAIGNGTAGRETELFAADLIRELAAAGRQVQYMVVSEAGASVYSASPLAAEEFPQYDVNLRSAVSIARRLQDPLAELVKIEPRAVGVGQYQHDMPQKRLEETLDGVVEDCVNSVGVDLNTASAPLLRRVAGLTAATAKAIVAKREADGPFPARAELKKVKGLGPRAYQQCAGFLRLPGAVREPLDATAVHPESYPAARALLAACGHTPADIGTAALAGLPDRVQKEKAALCAKLGVGEPTLLDIASELCRPGRDVRDSLPPPLLRSDVMGIADIKPGMELQGTVRNVIDFGAFVDIGVHQDGLVHISQITDRFLKHPREALKVGQVVRVRVLAVDAAKKRISLTMKGVPQA